MIIEGLFTSSQDGFSGVKLTLRCLFKRYFLFWLTVGVMTSRIKLVGKRGRYGYDRDDY